MVGGVSDPPSRTKHIGQLAVYLGSMVVDINSWFLIDARTGRSFCRRPAACPLLASFPLPCFAYDSRTTSPMSLTLARRPRKGASLCARASCSQKVLACALAVKVLRLLPQGDLKTFCIDCHVMGSLAAAPWRSSSVHPRYLSSDTSRTDSTWIVAWIILMPVCLSNGTGASE